MDQEMDPAAATHFARSRTAAGPVLQLKSGDALELAFIVGDESEPRGFGVSSNPEIVTTDHLAAGLQRCANLAVGCRRFPRQGNHRQKRYKAPERLQSMCALLASLRAMMQLAIGNHRNNGVAMLHLAESRGHRSFITFYF